MGGVVVSCALGAYLRSPGAALAGSAFLAATAPLAVGSTAVTSAPRRVATAHYSFEPKPVDMMQSSE